MSYQIEPGERVGDAVRRIVDEEIACAAAELSSVGQGDPERSPVHEARKHCKRIRAILRLFRGPLGDRGHAEETVVRDAARALAGLRECEADVEAFASLIDKEQDQQRRARLASAREVFVARRSAVMSDPAMVRSAVEDSLAHLELARSRIGEWSASIPEGFDAMSEGFRWTYSRARKAMKAALSEPTDENYHTWRTWLKHHGCQLRLLSPRDGSKLAKHLKEVEELSDRLGFDHDLAMLAQSISEWPLQLGGESEVEVISDIVARRRRKAQKKAEAASRRVFAEKPGRMVRRMEKRWGNRPQRADSERAIPEVA